MARTDILVREGARNMLRFFLLKPSLLKWWLPGVVLAVLASVIYAIIYRSYHYLRGRRNRDDGIPCIECARTAFPMEGTTQRYRCWMCGCRFEGPEHF
jgi:hypothetical protein